MKDNSDGHFRNFSLTKVPTFFYEYTWKNYFKKLILYSEVIFFFLKCFSSLYVNF